MNSLVNFIAARAVDKRNQRLRGEYHSFLNGINPNDNLFLVGSNAAEWDERVWDRVLYSQIDQAQSTQGVGGIVFCSETEKFEELYGQYGGDPDFLFFGRNASYDFMEGVSQDELMQGLWALMDFYRESNQRSSQNPETVMDLFIRHLGIQSYAELSRCGTDLAESLSVSAFLNRLERSYRVPYGFEMALNRYWENDIPAFVTFMNRLELDMRKARANDAPEWSVARAVAEGKIVVICAAVSDVYLKMAVCTEMLWLNKIGYPYDWITFRTGLPKTLSEKLFVGMTDQQRFCMIASTIGECGLELEWIQNQWPTIVCLGVTGKDAEALANFYNTNYREESVNLHMHHGIGAGFHAAMMPGMDPNILTSQRIFRGGAVILQPGRYTICSYLLT